MAISTVSCLITKLAHLDTPLKQLGSFNQEIVLLRIPQAIIDDTLSAGRQSMSAITEVGTSTALLLLPNEILALVAETVDILSRPNFAMTCKAILSIYYILPQRLRVSVGDLFHRSRQFLFLKSYPFFNCDQYPGALRNTIQNDLWVPRLPKGYARTQGCIQLVKTVENAMVIFQQFREEHRVLRSLPFNDSFIVPVPPEVLRAHDEALSDIFKCNMKYHAAVEESALDIEPIPMQRPIWSKLGCTEDEYERLSAVQRRATHAWLKSFERGIYVNALLWSRPDQ